MRHKSSQHLYHYWNGLRGQRVAPRRFEVEPSSIGDALPDSFILERHNAGTFSYRLAGTRLCERFKTEFRGHDFTASWRADDAGTVRSRLNTVSVQGGVVLLLSEGRSSSDRFVRIETLILPLVHGPVGADRFLGVMTALDVPSWLGFDPLRSLDLLTDEIIWPDGHPHGFTRPLDDMDDRQTPFLPRVRQSRIVRSDRRQFRVFDGGLSSGGQPVTPET